MDELIKLHGGKNMMATSIYSDAKHCNVFIVIVPWFVDSGLTQTLASSRIHFEASAES